MVDSTSLRQTANQHRKLADILDEAAARIDELGQQPSQIEQGMTRHPRSPITTASSRDLCYTVLRQAGQPMTRAQIMDSLQNAHRNVTDGTLQTYLSRDKRLMSLGRGIWSLRPEPQGNNGGK